MIAIVFAMIAIVFAMIATILLMSGKWLQIVTVSSTSPHFTLLVPELSPTVVMDEDEEQEQADCYLNHTDRIKPFAKSHFYVMLDTETDEVIVKHKCPVHPAELVSNR
jgi:hypothetical protein